jgi:hypothetical protein
MKDESLENSVITLHGKGWPIRKISKEMGISRGRVRRWLVSNSILRDTTPGEMIPAKKRRQSKLDPYKEIISELLGKYPDITAQRVYECLMEKGYDGKPPYFGIISAVYVRWVQKRRYGWWKRTRVRGLHMTGAITTSGLPHKIRE